MKSNMYDEFYAIEEKHWWFRAKREIVLTLLNDLTRTNHDKDLQIADFGCGCGLMLECLKQYGQVTGMDFSEKALEYCRQKDKSVTLLQNDLESHRIELEDKFDYAVVLDVIEHIKDDLVAMKNIHSYMKFGGG